MTTSEVAARLVELFNQDKTEELYAELYSPEVESIEADAGPGQVSKGMAGIEAKNKWWTSTFDVKDCVVDGPWTHGNQFILTFEMTTVEKATGKEMHMKEGALYTVESGKVVTERFFQAG